MSEDIFIDIRTPEGQKTWSDAHPCERFIDEEEGTPFIRKQTPEYIAEVEKMVSETEIPKEEDIEWYRLPNEKR